MAFVLADRVRETTSSTGTGTVTLAGAYSGFQTFAAIGNGNSTYYAIFDPASNAWEVGIGTYTSAGTTLSRDTILSSSNAGAAVNFGAGVKDVFVTQPASRVEIMAENPQLTRSIGATGSYTLPGGLIIKWGISAVTTGTPLAVTFATAFPTTTVAITTGFSAPSGAANTAYVSTYSNSSMTLNVYGLAGTSSVHWIALGY